MYLKSIHIQNFRGIKDLNVTFNENVNVIIGPNGSHKTALIDAIRLFYSWGSPIRDFDITKEDFYREIIHNEDDSISEKVSNKIVFDYFFCNLSSKQQGAFYAYLFKDDTNVLARVTVTYEINAKGRIVASYTTGNPDSGQRADPKTFAYFISYYLGALRDSTRDLLSTRDNVLGKVIKRKIDRQNSEDAIKQIIKCANDTLLQQEEVCSTKQGINNNLRDIYKSVTQEIGLQIEQGQIEYIVNVIKPFIQLDSASDLNSLRLKSNSLGFNNIIYIATVLGDLADLQTDDEVPVCALFIEEPEAHLHPQLQINLYNFLTNADRGAKSQIFITTHSPSLVSRVPLDKIKVLNGNAITVGDCFGERAKENIQYDTVKHKSVDESQSSYYKNMLMRYLDVSRSQLLFAKGVCFVEGISEALLLNTFSRIMGKCFIENEIEIVNMTSTSFGQFLMLYNSSDSQRRLSQKAAFITDEDQYTDSCDKKYNTPQKLAYNNYELLNELRVNIYNGAVCSRIDNMNSLKNGQTQILIASGLKTLEYQICLSNVNIIKAEIPNNSLYKYIQQINPDGIGVVNNYITTIATDKLSTDEKRNVALLLWKCLPSKSEFAQNLSFYLETEIKNRTLVFEVPQYIKDSVNHLV